MVRHIEANQIIDELLDSASRTSAQARHPGGQTSVRGAARAVWRMCVRGGVATPKYVCTSSCFSFLLCVYHGLAMAAKRVIFAPRPFEKI